MTPFPRNKVIAAAGLALLFVFAWLVYDFGKLRGADELSTLRTEHVLLERRLGEVSDERDNLREQLALHKRSSQIDRQAAEAVKSELGALEESLQAAREEIAFYKGIVAPGDVKPGLRVHRFRLESGAGPGEYHYELVLTQLKHNERFVSGVVDWKVKGSLLGEPGELSLEGITRPPTGELKFRFRYFQELNGTVILPENFEAETVELRVTPSGKNSPKPVVREFEWAMSGH